jgi:hypothetical protein
LRRFIFNFTCVTINFFTTDGFFSSQKSKFG